MQNFLNKLHQYMRIGTPAERKIARYFSDHLQELPFETAASIAARLDLSPMTVGRFLRALGYRGLDSIKFGMRDVAAAGPADSDKDVPERAGALETLQQQIEAIGSITQLAAGPSWTLATEAMIAAREIIILSDTRVGGLMRRFQERLSRVRDNVCGFDTPENFLGPLTRTDAAGCLLVLIDCHHFRETQTLLTFARDIGYRVLLITWTQTKGHSPERAPSSFEADITLSLSPLRSESDRYLALLAVMLECLAAEISQGIGPAAATRNARVLALETMLAELR